ncbi:hypothetical protein [Adlercreutzia caecimuris]|nr:hypothetical protein [Adlercreutzia caecimuris]
MRELYTSVLAGILSAALWEAIKWVAASARARKKPADDDQTGRA